MPVFLMRGAYNLLLPEGTPVLTGITPAEGAPRQVVTMTASGRNTHFAAGATTVTSVTVVDATTLLAQMTIAGDAVGVRTVTAATGAEEAILPNGLRIE